MLPSNRGVGRENAISMLISIKFIGKYIALIAMQLCVLA